MSRSPKVSESPLRKSWARSIGGCLKEAAEFLELDLSDAKATEIVQVINQVVVDLQAGELGEYGLESEDIEGETYVTMLAVLWGQQMVDALCWEWVELILDGDKSTAALAVVSPNRSMAITPFFFVRDCIDGRCEVKIALSFDMLLHNSRIPEFPPKSYTFILDRIQHIIPPR